MFGLPFTVPSWALKALGILAVVVFIGFAVHEWKLAIAGEAVAKVETVAVQHARHVEVASSQLSTRTSTAEATTQAAIVAKGRVIHDKVYVHVQDHLPASGCITYGFLRHLDAAGLGLDPSDVGSPAGQPDDACAPLSPRDAAATIGDRLTDARANAEQLDALIADVKARIAIANGLEKPQDGQDAPH